MTIVGNPYSLMSLSLDQEFSRMIEGLSLHLRQNRIFRPRDKKRGAPKIWTEERLMALVAALDDLRSRRSLSVLSAVAILHKKPEWSRWDGETLRKRYREGKRLFGH